MMIIKNIKEILIAVVLEKIIIEIVQNLMLNDIYIGRYTKTFSQIGMAKSR